MCKKYFIIPAIVLLPLMMFSFTVSLNDVQLESGLKLVSQSSQGVSLTYSMEEFLIEDVLVDGDTLQKVSIADCFLPGQAGTPDVPYISTYIALPQEADGSVSVINYKVAYYNDIDLAPVYMIPTENQTDRNYFFDDSIYLVDEYYPDNFIKLGEKTILRGIDCIPFAFRPFRYNPVTRKLMVFYDIELDINFSGGNGHFGEDRLRSRWWEPINQGFFLNYNSLPDIDFSYKGRQRPDEYEYIIFYPENDEFSDAAKILKEFRTKQGISTGIISLSDPEIGGNDYDNIWVYLATVYYTWELPPVAFCLLGDYGNDENTITSLEYSYTHENRTYTPLSDNLFADVDGNHFPDMVMSRITASTLTELDTMIEKTIDYETNPPIEYNVYSHPIIAGGWENERGFIFCTESIAGFMTNILGKNPERLYAIYSGEVSGEWLDCVGSDEYYFFSDNNYLMASTPEQIEDLGLSDFESDCYDVNDAINSGSFFVMHRDHGYGTGWGAPGYSTTEIAILNNEELPFVLSVNCSTGDFDYHEPGGELSICFAEAIHRSDNGALCVIAATDVTWSEVNDYFTWGITDCIWGNFWEEEDEENNPNYLKPCFANVYSKLFIQETGWLTQDELVTATFYLYHYHGDAFNTIYTEVPQNLTVHYSNNIEPEIENIVILANNGALTCLSIQIPDGNNGFFTEIIDHDTSENGRVNLDLTDYVLESGMQLDLVITKDNFFRFEEDIEVIESDLRGNVILSNYTDEGGVLVELFSSTGVAISEAVSNINGEYNFADIESGSYFLQYSITDYGRPHYTTSSDIFTYDSSQGIMILPSYTMTEIIPESIVVSQNPEVPSFNSLSESEAFVNGYINSDYYSGEDISIYIGNGTYYTPLSKIVNFANTEEDQNVNITLNGVNEVIFYPEVISNTNGTNSISYSLSRINLEVNDIDFKNYSTAADIISMNNSHISFIDCVFEDNGLYWNEVTEEYENFSSGGAIKLEDHGEGKGNLYLHIDGCSFINNQVSRGDGLDADFDLIPINNGMGGAICIDLRSNEFYDVSGIEIVDNDFENCGANYGGAIFMNEAKNVYIEDNEFKDNHFAVVDTDNPLHNAKKGAAIAMIRTDLNMTGNLFNDQSNYQDLYGAYVNWISECGELSSINNSYIDNNNLECFLLEDSDFIVMINDLYDKDSGLVNYSVTIEDTPYEISYCLSYGQNGLDFIVDGTGTIENCLYTDPELDGNFAPIWDETTFSPCIDAGDPEIFDPDGTPSDIGAVCAIDHRVDAIELIDMAEGVNWKSFPVLDDITTDGDIAANVLYDIMQPPYPAALNLVETQGGWYDIIFEYPYWNNDNQQFTSDKGYKIHMNNEYTIEITGFLEDRYHTLELETGVENWLGYFVEYSMKPLDAFEAVLDKIDMIKTRDFSLVKIQGEWFGTCEWTINYGDLVIVHSTENGSFFWGEDGGGGVEKTIRSSSLDFVYTEEADYIPVIVELDTEALGNPSEIGIFVEEECKGAEVITDSVVQIRAYVFGDTIAFDPGEVSFQLSYGTRAENRKLNNYSIKMDPGEKGKKETLDFSKKRKRYYLISLKDTDGAEPEIIATSLGVNYPNPFNPVTTINYSLANQGQVELAVYNIKGQKVRTLVNEVQESGQYQVIWDGTNDKYKLVASGIYFYRMNADEQILHKKMLLMK